MTERMMAIAVGAQEIQGRSHAKPAAVVFGCRWRAVAGAAVAAVVAMNAASGSAAGQGQPSGGGTGSLEELFDRDPRKYATSEVSRPLAVAYLAASFSGGPKGPSTSFRIGAKAPGTSLSAKLMHPDGQPWEGYRVALYKGTELLSYEGSRLRLGGQPPLSLTLYAFVPESRPVKISRILTWDSDAWSEKADEFAVLSDTSFQVQANPVINGVLASSLREVVACVNKRSQHPECDGQAGAVIEDPL